MGQFGRYFIAASIPTALLLVWAIRATPTEAAFTGLLVGLPVTLALTMATGIMAARRSGRFTPARVAGQQIPTAALAAGQRGPVWPVILAGTVATAVYWFRVWSYPGMEQWDLGGVLVLVYNIRVVRTQQGDILRYHAGEADIARPVWELATFNRKLLKNGGRLEADSLAAMRETSVRVDLQAFERRMQLQVAGDAVRITFTPPGPLNAATAGLYSSAWATANKIVQEVTRYFPEIDRFQVELAGFKTAVRRPEVGTGFRLQHRLLRSDRILGIMIRRGDRKAHPAHPAFHLFDPKSGLQIAVVVFDGPLDSHIPGVLFEEMTLAPGLLYVVGIDANGTVTFMIGDENRFHGPLSVPAGGETIVNGTMIANLGWLDAGRFERRRQK